jgi:hypothetical protein
MDSFSVGLHPAEDKGVIHDEPARIGRTDELECLDSNAYTKDSRQSGSKGILAIRNVSKGEKFKSLLALTGNAG